MKYRLIKLEYKPFADTIQLDSITVTKLDHTDRVERSTKASYYPFWYAPETISPYKALEMFVDAQIEGLAKEIEQKQNLIQQLIKAKNTTKIPKD